MQTSIEVEYWVIDREGELTDPGALLDHSAQVDPEFVEPVLELKTTPCESVGELRSTFVDLLEGVLARAAELEKGLVPLGTPINGEPIDRRPGERGRIQEAVVGSNFAFSKYCAGTHLHFEQRNVVDQLNALIALDPALALCNSSPYLHGERVAAGARAYCYRRLGYADFPKHGQLWHYVDTVAQWHRRLDRRYDEFRDAAMAEDVDPEAFDEQFSPDDVVWTPIRLREEMPTVEWRSPDATLPSQLLRLAEAVDGVLEAAHHTNVRVAGERESDVGRAEGGGRTDTDERRADRGGRTDTGGGRDGDGQTDSNSGIDAGWDRAVESEYPPQIDAGAAGLTEEALVLPAFEPLCDLVGAAMHDGMAADPVVDYLERMGMPTDDFHPLSAQIDGREYVPVSDARELRLEFADRLESDVAALAAEGDR